MMVLLPLRNPQTALLPLSQRKPAGVISARLCAWHETLRAFLRDYAQAANAQGLVYTKGLPMPGPQQLNALLPLLPGDLTRADWPALVARWLPDWPQTRQASCGEALQAELTDFAAGSPTPGAQRNLMAKLLCWLKAESPRWAALPPDQAGKLLWTAPVSAHELRFLRVLARCGCDLLVLCLDGGGQYEKVDGGSAFTTVVQLPGMGAFPQDIGQLWQPSAPVPKAEQPASALVSFAVKPKAEPASAVKPQRAQNTPVSAAKPQAVPSSAAKPAPKSAPKPVKAPQPGPAAPLKPVAAPAPAVQLPREEAPLRLGTNVWLPSADWQLVTTPPEQRGKEPGFLRNAFLQVIGAEDALSYQQELYQLQLKLKEQGRPVAIHSGPLPQPSPVDIEHIHRGDGNTLDALLVGLHRNLAGGADPDLMRYARCALTEVLRDAAAGGATLPWLRTTGVLLVWWLKRFIPQLFPGRRQGLLAAFLWMRGPQDRREALFASLLARMPADVVCFWPDPATAQELTDPHVLALHYAQGADVSVYPTAGTALRTAAATAEGELNQLLYQDSGLYRRGQFTRAQSLPLQTSLAEVWQLWNQPLRYRPGFATAGDTAHLPVLFTQVSGVMEGKELPYWQQVKALTGNGVLFIRELPWLPDTQADPFATLAREALNRGQLQRQRLMDHRLYPFRALRQETQDHLLDALQQLLDSRAIRGIGVNGTEYTVISTVLGLDKTLLRQIQSFDFTGENPKALAVHTREGTGSLRDAITLYYLMLVGFDVVLFSPSGYQTLQPCLQGIPLQEHQAGPYQYDLRLPDLDSLPMPKKGWLEQLGQLLGKR